MMGWNTATTKVMYRLFKNMTLITKINYYFTSNIFDIILLSKTA